MSDHTRSDRPLPKCKTSIVKTAKIFASLKANTKETTKEVARQKAAPPDLWWRPTAATFVVPMNRVDVVALNTIFVLRLSQAGRTVGRTDSRLDGRPAGVDPDQLLESGYNIFTRTWSYRSGRNMPPNPYHTLQYVGVAPHDDIHWGRGTKFI